MSVLSARVLEHYQSAVVYDRATVFIMNTLLLEVTWGLSCICTFSINHCTLYCFTLPCRFVSCLFKAILHFILCNDPMLY